MDLLVILLFIVMILARWTSGVSYAFPLFWLAIFLFSISLRERRVRSRSDFVNQLKSCRKELRRGGSVVVDNLVLRYNSPLTTFHLSVGALFFNVDIPSRYRLAYGENHPEAVAFSLCSLAFGWWSIPHGPLRTLHTLLFNIKGGKRTTVAELIDGVIFERLVAAENQALRSNECTATNTDKQERLAETGPGSRSQRMLTNRIEPEPAPSLEERIAEFYRPKPVGKRLVEAWRKRLALKAQEAKRAVKSISERTQSATPHAKSRDHSDS